MEMTKYLVLSLAFVGSAYAGYTKEEAEQKMMMLASLPLNLIE